MVRRTLLPRRYFNRPLPPTRRGEGFEEKVWSIFPAKRPLSTTVALGRYSTIKILTEALRIDPRRSEKMSGMCSPLILKTVKRLVSPTSSVPPCPRGSAKDYLKGPEAYPPLPRNRPGDFLSPHPSGSRPPIGLETAVPHLDSPHLSSPGTLRPSPRYRQGQEPDQGRKPPRRIHGRTR